jgi:HlyD family secretion protein
MRKFMERSQRAMIVATLFVVMLAGCAKGGKGGAQAGPPPITVDTAQAKRSDIATYIPLDGQIAPMMSSTLSTPQQGTVTAVYVFEGTHVHKGELLAKIDDSLLRAQLLQAQGQEAQALAQLQGQTLQNPITSTTVTSNVTTAEQTLAAAKNTLVSDEAAEDNAKLVNQQNETLLKQGYVSLTTTVQSRAQLVAARQATNNARTAVTQAIAALATARRNLGQSGIQVQTVAAAKGTYEAAVGNRKLLETDIAQTNIVAPFDGVVTSRLLDPGSFAGPNAPIVAVSQVDPVYVNVNVPDEDLSYVRRGTVVTFTSSSVPGKTFSGPVFDVNATPTSGTLSYRARLVLHNPDNTLRGGMLVSVQVLKQKDVGVVVVPRSAVFTAENGSNVFTVVDPPAGTPAAGGTFKQAKLIPVQVGLQTDTMVEVRSPQIQPGTTIITTRPDALQDKSIVAMSVPASQGGTSSGNP